MTVVEKTHYFKRTDPIDFPAKVIQCETKIGKVHLIKRDSDKRITAKIFTSDNPWFKNSLFLIYKNELLGVLTYKYNSIYEIERLKAFKHDTYKGIGTALIQTLCEKILLNNSFSKNNTCPLNKIHLDASDNSHGFYYKLGFRAVKEDDNDLIKEALEQTDSDSISKTTNLFSGCLPMQLKYESDLLKMVERKPILKEAKVALKANQLFS